MPDGSGRIIYLNRPCGACGQDHFNFEHPNANAIGPVDEARSYPLHNVGDGSFLFGSMTNSYPSPDSSPDNNTKKRGGPSLYSAQQKEWSPIYSEPDSGDEDGNFEFYSMKLLDYQKN